MHDYAMIEDCIAGMVAPYLTDSSKWKFLNPYQQHELIAEIDLRSFHRKQDVALSDCPWFLYHPGLKCHVDTTDTHYGIEERIADMVAPYLTNPSCWKTLHPDLRYQLIAEIDICNSQRGRGLVPSEQPEYCYHPQLIF